MIIGIGHDLSDVDRVAGILEGSAGERFIARVLAGVEREIAESLSGRRLAEFVAGRFAAKEAIVKALGCGIGAVVGLQDIVVGRDENGKPVAKLSAEAIRRLGWDAPDNRSAQSNRRIHVTITHERTLASAFAIVEQLP